MLEWVQETIIFIHIYVFNDFIVFIRSVSHQAISFYFIFLKSPQLTIEFRVYLLNLGIFQIDGTYRKDPDFRN